MSAQSRANSAQTWPILGNVFTCGQTRPNLGHATALCPEVLVGIRRPSPEEYFYKMQALRRRQTSLGKLFSKITPKMDAWGATACEQGSPCADTGGSPGVWKIRETSEFRRNGKTAGSPGDTPCRDFVEQTCLLGPNAPLRFPTERGSFSVDRWSLFWSGSEVCDVGGYVDARMI